jgi:hypothetical protein
MKFDETNTKLNRRYNMSLERVFGKKVKARFAHTCMYCRDAIQEKEIYHCNRYFDLETREAEVYKLHLGCVDMYYYEHEEIEKHADHWEDWHESVFV